MPKTLGKNVFNQVWKWVHVLKKRGCGIKKEREKTNSTVCGESLDWATLIKLEM